MMNFFLYATMTVFIIVCIFLILLVLIQKGRGGGLASAFGGAGGNTAFGSKTGDVLTWATSVVFGIFLVLAIVLNLLANTTHKRRLGLVPGGAPALTTPAPTTPPAQPPTTLPTTLPTTQP
jgi:preprotein translocase subunit SecG